MMQIRASGSLAPSLLALLLWAGNAQAVPCQNNLPASNPDAVYTDHGNGTVTDTRTGLMWKQCAEGLSGATCWTGSLQHLTWANALAQAEASTFASYSDWRLPNVKELSSLVEECRALPAINTNRFPNTSSSFFWAGSPYAGSPSYAWSVSFNNGFAHPSFRSDNRRVRLVRGGPGPRSGDELFFDDFNDDSIDTTKWIYGGDRVVELNGELRVSVDTTDHGGGAYSTPIQIDPVTPLVLRKRTKVYAANSYFDGDMSFRFPGHDGYRFGISYADYAYTGGSGETKECVTYGFSVFRNNANTHICADQIANTSGLIPPIWGEWFDEVISYNPTNGQLLYYINDVLRIDYNVGVLPVGANTMDIVIGAWGWNTGHYHYVDRIEVVQ